MKLKREPKTNYPVLNICKEYSDKDHLLNYEKIQKYLLKEYAMNVDKDVVHESLQQLLDIGVNIHVDGECLFYDQRTFNYEDAKKQCSYIQTLTIQQSVKDKITERLMNELSVYQRKKLKEELRYDISLDQ